MDVDGKMAKLENFVSNNLPDGELMIQRIIANREAVDS